MSTRSGPFKVHSTRAFLGSMIGHIGKQAFHPYSLVAINANECPTPRLPPSGSAAPSRKSKCSTTIAFGGSRARRLVKTRLLGPIHTYMDFFVYGDNDVVSDVIHPLSSFLLLQEDISVNGCKIMRKCREHFY